MTKRITAMVLAMLMLLSLMACGNGAGSSSEASSAGKQTLKIAYFKGGLGEEWIKALATKFETENAGVKIELEGDPAITEKMGPRLESGANLPDLAFILQTSWQRWALKGYLEDLSTLYSTEVESGKTLKDKLQPGDVNVGLIQKKYWVVPWTDGATGIVYNAKMFEQNAWNVPSTVKELYDLLPKIKEKGIAPFAWGGKVIGYWDFAVKGWWAQYQGFDGIETYKAMKGPEVYAQEGRLKALEVFEKLIMDPTNSIEGANGMDHIQSQMAFLQGKAAMIPNGGWLENEMKSSLPAGFVMKMMPLPTVEGAKDTKINYTAAGDFIVIPSGSKQKDLAKKFLLFMSRDDMLKLFTEKCGSIRPFQYDPTTVSGLSEFNKSVINIWKTSKNIYLFSENPVYYNKFFDWPANGAPYAMILAEDETAQSAFDADATFAKQNWDAAMEEMK